MSSAIPKAGRAGPADCEDCSHREEHGHEAKLEAHAVVGATGIIRKAESPEGAEELAEPDKVIAVVVGVGDIDLLLQMDAFAQ